ncbi:hypothetical protein [Actinoplanes sp. NPDC049802]|uniref:hypothetical protein n=1 Tax=Actinoplanes sp. NPDC049802 TaxID=3154742 RepID=UPI0033C9607D
MRDHPCHRHRPGRHTSDCLTAACGFCGTGRAQAASGECRACLRLVCGACDGGFLPDLGPLCGPCTPPPRTTVVLDDPESMDGFESNRLCVFEFDLSCGHIVTAVRTGWYPVSVACCSRLGGTIRQGDYVPYASDVDYVRVLVENYELRPRGTLHPTLEIIGRRPRTDEPSSPSFFDDGGSAGRFPARVGAV